MLMHAKLAIMVHRTVLLQESELSKMFSWTMKELKFALIAVGLYIGVFMTIGILSAFVIPLTVDIEKTNYLSLMFIPIFIVLGLIVVSRVSLVFPAIAIKKNMKLADSWRRTKGYTFSLFVLLILIPLLSNLIHYNLTGDSAILSVVFSFISIFVLIFEVTILSHCFVVLFGEDEDSDSDIMTEIL
jgi:hypothetical protein